MNNRPAELAQRRRDLRTRCELQRQQALFLCGHIESKLTAADHAVDVVTGIAKNPLLLVAAIAGTMILGPWRIMRWVGQGAMLYNVFRKVRALIG
jgi:hypothetical protein